VGIAEWIQRLENYLKQKQCKILSFLFFLTLPGLSNTDLNAQKYNARENVSEVQVSANDNFQLLTGPQVQLLFKGFDNVEYPTSGASSTSDDWQFNFDAGHLWEGKMDVAWSEETWGRWRIDGGRFVSGLKAGQSTPNPTRDVLPYMRIGLRERSQDISRNLVKVDTF
jgi:hypothetical protein